MVFFLSHKKVRKNYLWLTANVTKSFSPAANVKNTTTLQPAIRNFIQPKWKSKNIADAAIR